MTCVGILAEVSGARGFLRWKSGKNIITAECIGTLDERKNLVAPTLSFFTGYDQQTDHTITTTTTAVPPPKINLATGHRRMDQTAVLKKKNHFIFLINFRTCPESWKVVRWCVFSSSLHVQTHTASRRRNLAIKLLYKYKHYTLQ